MNVSPRHWTLITFGATRDSRRKINIHTFSHYTCSSAKTERVWPRVKYYWECVDFVKLCKKNCRFDVVKLKKFFTRSTFEDWLVFRSKVFVFWRLTQKKPRTAVCFRHKAKPWHSYVPSVCFVNIPIHLQTSSKLNRNAITVSPMLTKCLPSLHFYVLWSIIRLLFVKQISMN